MSAMVADLVFTLRNPGESCLVTRGYTQDQRSRCQNRVDSSSQLGNGEPISS
jgi:hypothetical protein